MDRVRAQKRPRRICARKGPIYIPLVGAGYLSFGGEARERFETYRNEEFSPNPNADNAYLLQRYLFHADYHPAECLRVFAEL